MFLSYSPKRRLSMIIIIVSLSTSILTVRDAAEELIELLESTMHRIQKNISMR